MKFETGTRAAYEDLINFFGDVFTASEGETEGNVIRRFVTDLLDTRETDLKVFTARDGDHLVGAVCFTRMTFQNDPRAVFILSPMAVATTRQGQRIGQNLIKHALDALRKEAVDVAITYGDPNFYNRVGFSQVSARDVPPPLTPSYPDGWLAQTLDGQPLVPFQGPSSCVPALSHQHLW